MKLHAKDVHACWSIARRDAEMYQRKMNKQGASGRTYVICKAARDAADRIAQKIRYGRRLLRARKGLGGPAR